MLFRQIFLQLVDFLSLSFVVCKAMQTLEKVQMAKEERQQQQQQQQLQQQQQQEQQQQLQGKNLPLSDKN